MYIIYAIIALSIAATIHEFGHLIMAKKGGMQVEEFSIGFGPKIISFIKNETLYSLRIIPFLAYVKIRGMDDKLETPEGYYKKPLKSRLLTVLGGPFANILLAILIFIILFSTFGDFNNLSTTIFSVQENSPAYSAGLKSGDKILYINDKEIKTWDDVRNEIQNSNGNEIKIVVKRGGDTLTFYVKPTLENERWVIGIISGFEKLNFFQAIYYSFKEVLRVILLFLSSIRLIITGRATGGIVGPVGIVQVASNIGKSAGLFGIIWFSAILNILLALTNLLPIPALDGGRIPFLIYEWITKKRVPPEKENLVHLIGFIFLLGLLFLVTFFDILRWIK
ncbi:MAG: RIP metalloprotease RseP [Caldisericia bacterium]|nr:RIP metalloprotease RseP [Caldisericia bacterium]